MLKRLQIYLAVVVLSVSFLFAVSGKATGTTYTVDGDVNDLFFSQGGSFSITTSAGTGGTISPANATLDIMNNPGQAFNVLPNTGYSIASVSGCGLSTNTYTSIINQACTITATFSANPVNGTCGSSSGGTFTTAPTGNLCSAGTASAVSGSGPWTWTCGGTNGGSNASCSANISTNSSTIHSLKIVKLGTGNGTVSGSNIDCGSTCSASFNSGSSVTLSAVISSGSTFAGWSGGGCSGTGTCSLTMDADKTVLAIFTAPAQSAPSADNCKASIYTQSSIYHLNTPIIEFFSTGLLPAYYNADFEYVPTTDGSLWFKVSTADVVADTTSFINCQATLLSQNGSDYYLFVPRLILGNASYWVLLQYSPGGSGIMFKVVNYGQN